MVPIFTLYVIPTILILFALRKYRESKWGKCKNNNKLSKKVTIITGANSGIGYEIAKELAARDSLVILACRNIQLAQQAIKKIENELSNNPKLEAIELDLASLQSIKTFANLINEKYRKVHILINNAGVSYPINNNRQVTKDGFEIHFGVNHLGHFYLTNLLLDKLKNSQPSRIITISSALHEKGEINVNSPQFEKKLYANSKLANIYFCRELATRLRNSNVNVYAVCPGWVYTNLFRHSIKWYHYILVFPIAFLFMRNSKSGAQTAIYCATESDLDNESGLIYRDCTHYVSKMKFDDKIALELWKSSEELIRSKID